MLNKTSGKREPLEPFISSDNLIRVMNALERKKQRRYALVRIDINSFTRRQSNPKANGGNRNALYKRHFSPIIRLNKFRGKHYG